MRLANPLLLRAIARTLLTMVLVFGLTALALAQQAEPGLAIASDTALDLEPPRIEFEPINRGLAGEAQVFSANVTDDNGLADVYLYYRLFGDEAYSVSTMERLENSDLYSATIATSTDDPRDIEYYLVAEDRSGNKTLRGFAFDPLVRDITADVVAAGGTLATSVGMSRQRKILWTVLGIAAVGLLASQMGDSGGSDGDTPNPIGITVTPVEN